MSISRLLSVLVAVVLVVTAFLAIRAGMATGTTVSSGQDLSDYFQRHPGASVAAAGADLSDYVLRHPASAIPAGSVASDWFERHAESLTAGNAVDLSDYFQRHSGLVNAAKEAPQVPTSARTAVLEQGRRYDRAPIAVKPAASSRTTVLEGSRLDRAQPAAR